MNHMESFAPVPTPTKEPPESDLTLLKMATVCGYPGASPRWLPFIHSSFPPASTSISARYYGAYPRKDTEKTDQPDHDSQAIVCYKEPTYIQLPELFQAPAERRPLTRSDIGYIQKNKVCFKLKGINPKQVYSVNRLRPNVSDQHRHGQECLRVNPQRAPTLMDMRTHGTWNIALDSMTNPALHVAHPDPRRKLTTTPEVGYLSRTVSDNVLQRARDKEVRSEPYVAMRRLLENQSRNFVPGLRPRKMKEGQVLGHVMSSRRLRDLLRDDKKKLTYTFHQADV